jgi:hypothetical protein
VVSAASWSFVSYWSLALGCMAVWLGAQVRANFLPRGLGPKLLRYRVVGLGWGWGGRRGWGGGEDELQRVTQACQWRFSDSFLEASVTFSIVCGGEHWLTSGLEFPAEKGLPSD